MNKCERRRVLSASEEGGGSVVAVKKGRDPTVAAVGGGGGEIGEEEKLELSLNSSKEGNIKGEKLVRKGRGGKVQMRRSSGGVEEDVYVSPLDYNIWVFFGGLVLILLGAIFTRFYKISQPKHIA